jgi:hypothetical protein
MRLFMSALDCGGCYKIDRPLRSCHSKVKFRIGQLSGIQKMGLKIIESYDGSFVLEPEAKAVLLSLLTAESFLQQVALQLQCSRLEFTELLFQPVPYSSETPKGMPAEFEQYHGKSDFAIVNVPPNFMFQAKVFKPSRLCAIYRVFKN